MSDTTTIILIAVIALVGYVAYTAITKTAPIVLGNAIDCGIKNCPVCNKRGGLQTTACGQCLDSKCR